MGFDDSDGSAKAVLNKPKKAYEHYRIILCNGGDRTKDNIPEMEVEGIEFEFEARGDNNPNSSSWILKEWQYPNYTKSLGRVCRLVQDDRKRKGVDN